jgi:transposase-like protein
MTQPVARDPIYRRPVFDADVIELCVRWYITYRLSYRDLVEVMAERGIQVAHTTVLRWVTRYVPEFEKRWRGFSKVVDFPLRRDRGIAAAQAFFRKALASTLPRVPRKVTLDGHVPSRRALWLLRRDQAALRLDGWLQVVRQRGHYARRHRTRPPHSQEPILVWAWPTSPWLVAESRMGDGSRVNHKIAEHPIASACPIGPRMHQNRFGSLIALRLQKAPREQGCSVFLDSDLAPIADQWACPSRDQEAGGRDAAVPDRDFWGGSRATARDGD